MVRTTVGVIAGVLIGLAISTMALHQNVIPNGVQNWLCYHLYR